MEAIIIVLFVLSMLLYCLRVSTVKNLALTVSYFLFPAIFPYALYLQLIEKDRQYIQQLLADQSAMINFAFFIILEACLIVGSVFALAKQSINSKLNTRLAWLKYVPTFTPFLALCYFELQTFYIIQNYTFQTTALFFFVATVVTIGVAVSGIKWGIGELEIRFELIFILCLFQIFIGVVMGSFYNSIPTTAIIGKAIWKPFVAIVMVVVLFAGIGFLYSIRRINRQLNTFTKTKKNNGMGY